MTATVPVSAPGLVDVGLRDRLTLLSQHVRQLVEQRRAGDSDPDNPYRGLYVSDEEAQVLADESGERAIESRMHGWKSSPVPQPDSRLGSLATSFDLDSLDLDLLVIALAPDIEPRFEKLYGYLHDDLTRRRASVGLALELVGFGFGDPIGRTRFAPTSALVSQGLVEVEEGSRAVLTRPLRVPDRVVDFLLGVDHEDQQLRALTIPSVTLTGPDVERFSMVFQNGARFVYFQDGPSGIGAAIGASALAAAGWKPITLDLTRLPRREDADLVVRTAIREARMRRCGLVVIAHDSVTDVVPEVMSILTEGAWPTVVVGPEPWNPVWSPDAILGEVAPRPHAATVAGIWSAVLPEITASVLDEATCQLRLATGSDRPGRCSGPSSRRRYSERESTSDTWLPQRVHKTLRA